MRPEMTEEEEGWARGCEGARGEERRRGGEGVTGRGGWRGEGGSRRVPFTERFPVYVSAAWRYMRSYTVTPRNKQSRDRLQAAPEVPTVGCRA